MCNITSLPASVIGAEGRKVLIFIEDDKETECRLAFSLNGEPVAPVKVAVHKRDFARGHNLIRGGDFERPEVPWRFVGEASGRLGRNLSADWHLSGGFTAYLAAPLGQPVDIEYVTEVGGNVVPVSENENYRFEGYFAKHRCAASVWVELLDGDKKPVATYRETVPAKSGGRCIEDYAKVLVHIAVPPKCAYARLRLSIDQHVPTKGRQANDAYLFFCHLSFGITADGDFSWRPTRLSGDQALALTCGAAVLDVTLPRLYDSMQAKPSRFEVIDTRTGEPIQGSPIVLGVAPELRFTGASFDGVTLSGSVLGASGCECLELTVDASVALRHQLKADIENGIRQIKMRIPDTFLDGAPHVLELRDVASGSTLFVNAAMLKVLTTPWEALADFSRSPSLPELHPLGRRRYQNLLAHLSALSLSKEVNHTEASLQFLHQLHQCHDIIAREGAERRYPAKLVLPAEAAPEVSVVLYGPDLVSAYRTIAALILAHNRTRFEVIVASGDEPDKIAEFRAAVSGVNVVESADEFGRAALCNGAMRTARGRFIALLGTPAEPGVHWLDELRAAFEMFDGVGIAGCKLVKTDNRLYEAGGILWSSGSRQPFGRNGNAEHPQVNYTRQVDYVSGFALMIDREVWQMVDGFATDLLEPVLEDVDLALKVRARGRKVVYVPQAVVTVPQRAVSPIAAGGLPAEFKRRWSDAFRDYREEGPSTREAMDHGVSGRILFIDQQIPAADVDAGSYAAIQEIRLFQALGYKVTFLPMNLAHAGAHTLAVERMGVETIHAPFATSVEDVIKARAAEFDLVYITRYHVARATLPYVRRYNPRAKIVFNNADLHFLRELRAAIAQKNEELLRRSKLTRDLELEVIRQTDLTISYSDVEHAVIESHNFDQMRLAKAPWVVATATSIPKISERKNIAFLGSFGHQPNVEAVRFFASTVMPILRSELPDVQFLIYGSQMTPQVRALESADVVIKGHVSDLADAFNPVRVFVGPLTVGAGLKGKVLSAMSFGVPTVLAPAAAEAIGAHPDIHYLAATSPAEWVTAIKRLYHDEKKWAAVSDNALEFVRTHYSFERGLTTLRRALETIDIFPPRDAAALCCRLPLPPLELSSQS